jgi:hypothetical protein
MLELSKKEFYNFNRDTPLALLCNQSEWFSIEEFVKQINLLKK